MILIFEGSDPGHSYGIILMNNLLSSDALHVILIFEGSDPGCSYGIILMNNLLSSDANLWLFIVPVSMHCLMPISTHLPFYMFQYLVNVVNNLPILSLFLSLKDTNESLTLSIIQVCHLISVAKIL
jgi:hypothetical protein